MYERLTHAAEILIGAGDRRRDRGRLQRNALRLSGEALMLAEIYFPEEQAQFVRLLWHTQDLRLGSQSIRLLRRLGYRGLSMVPTLRVPLEHSLGAAAKA
ncbi:MAG: hypothetical protein J4G09_01320 [Proteobacteria bacterium]|nr:hypothetical protein [Pseudomonadota bacterium]